ncbi:uncharacterized protein L969DRAFT_88394 [Mixia osmundae IAM 14324]|uniref:Autophagy-related protein 101 n=1 Tax=Mixia osmundae (strain CBS 9802 / IAM 14324 / JCM 22182 / KY 12970) TaxID=764103 RepID=G7E703_MIXOS|nr:uncharacterized protein L969DRAFT_88394 [Mixia osmundae IAM 14324]KEI39004.1 hypothetical protein L969DRAFT_88394 [Mixia osmundae IAM 14324]GAA98613.1 hypothetical protein E5Q_05300 [Mixia osmundae IAM 14324]
MDDASPPIARLKHSITVDRSLLKDVASVLLHSILFLRCFGNTHPRTIDLLGLSFSAIQDAELEAVVQAKAQSISRAAEQHHLGPSLGRQASHPALQTLRVNLAFNERTTIKVWYGSKEADVPFERWSIELSIETGLTERERNKIEAKTRRDLRQFIFKSVTFAQTGRERLPAIKSSDLVCYPWSMSLASAEGPLDDTPSDKTAAIDEGPGRRAGMLSGAMW